MKCDVVGKNAADFVLVCELEKRLLIKKYETAYILSGDSGFDSACKYMSKEFKIKVKRIEDIDDIVYTGTAEYARYIINRFNSGVSYKKLLESSDGQEEQARRRVETLLRLKLVKLVNDKLYFSKRSLIEATDNHIKQVKYLDELFMR